MNAKRGEIIRRSATFNVGRSAGTGGKCKWRNFI